MLEKPHGEVIRAVVGAIKDLKYKTEYVDRDKSVVIVSTTFFPSEALVSMVIDVTSVGNRSKVKAHAFTSKLLWVTEMRLTKTEDVFLDRVNQLLA